MQQSDDTVRHLRKVHVRAIANGSGNRYQTFKTFFRNGSSGVSKWFNRVNSGAVGQCGQTCTDKIHTNADRAKTAAWGTRSRRRSRHCSGSLEGRWKGCPGLAVLPDGSSTALGTTPLTSACGPSLLGDPAASEGTSRCSYRTRRFRPSPETKK